MEDAVDRAKSYLVLLTSLLCGLKRNLATFESGNSGRRKALSTDNRPCKDIHTMEFCDGSRTRLSIGTKILVGIGLPAEVCRIDRGATCRARITGIRGLGLSNTKSNFDKPNFLLLVLRQH